MTARKIPSHPASPDENQQRRPTEADPVVPARAAPDEDRRARIAERAYSHAQRRGFRDNGQIEDWLNAEREIDQESRSSGVKEEASLKSDPISDKAINRLSSSPRASEEEHIEPDHVQDWAQRLGVASTRLREAIQRVGSRVPDIQQFLEDSAQPGEPSSTDTDSARKPRATRKRKSTSDGVNRDG